MGYRGSSRTIGVVAQCAVWIRGGKVCVWCLRRLRRPLPGRHGSASATIDHADGNHGNNARNNLLAACSKCNTARRFESSFITWLRKVGQTYAAGKRRAAKQLVAPLDMDEGRELAERWHPGRLEAQRENQRAYKARQKARMLAMAKCEECDGTGECASCDGDGECATCEGGGTVRRGERKAECGDCSGDCDCFDCNGTGECDYCGGTGETK